MSKGSGEEQEQAGRYMLGRVDGRGLRRGDAWVPARPPALRGLRTRRLQKGQYDVAL